jgi:uncharacterized alkaline shock family protein YloU
MPKKDAANEDRIREVEMATRLREIEETEEFVVAGETVIEDEVIEAIAGVAATEVKGVASLGTSSIRRTLAERIGGAERRGRGVDVEHGKKEAILDITVNVMYGVSIPELVIGVRKNVASRLLDLVGLIAKEINIQVADIEFPERISGELDSGCGVPGSADFGNDCTVGHY